MRSDSHTRPWWLIFGVLWALQILAFPLIERPSLGYDIWYTSFAVTTILAVVVGTRINRPRSRLPWYLIAAGLLCYTAGDSVYLAATLRGAEVGSPSIADAFYLPFYALIAVGLLLLIRRQSPGKGWASMIDAAIVTTGLSTVAWIFLMEPFAIDPTLSTGAKVLALAYPAMDLLLILVVARLLIGVSWTHPALRLLGAGVVFQLAGDVAYGVGVVNGWYGNGHPIEVLWLLSYASFGLMALHPSMARLADPTPEPDRPLGRWRLTLLSLATLLAPAMMAIQAVQADRYSLLVTVAASVVLFALVIARLVGVVARHSRLVRQELGLRQAAAAFVGARTPSEVAAVAAAGALTLVTEPSWAAVSWDGNDAVAAKAVESGEITAALDVRIDVEMHAGPAEVHLTPIAVNGQRFGVVGVAGRARLEGFEQEALEALALQAGQAMESIGLTRDLMNRQSAERFRALIQNSADLIVVLDDQLAVRYHTPSVQTALGRDADDITTESIESLVSPEDIPGLYALLRDLLSRRGETLHTECRLLHRDGSIRTVEIAASDLRDDPNVDGLVLTAHDITERKLLERELSRQAFHDPLTGLANRRLFVERITEALSRPEGARPIVLFIDLDDFKAVNDSLGHGAGDALLTIAAARLTDRLRAEDTVARLGGDEFGVLLDDATLQGARRVAADIITALGEPMNVFGTQLVTEASVGIAVGSVDLDADGLLRDADAAMYRAKASGKAQFAIFETSMRDEAAARVSMRTDLQRAVATREFVVHYQPIVDLADGQVVSCEALVRWEHPQRGLVSPVEFIPIAEETGLIVELGAWVLGAACERAAEWLRVDPDGPAVSVNLSARQLQEPDLARTVMTVLTQSGLPAEKLVLEITETVLMGRTPAMVASLDTLRATGIRVAIDDFGTGYSSLSYLQGFPVDILKIAKPFIDGVDQSDRRNRLLGAIVQLGATLGLTVVAEGVELEVQADRLRSFDCGLAQGFLFARPMDSASLTTWLAPASAWTEDEVIVAPTERSRD